MIRIGVSAAAGLTGWAARLLFASGTVCAIVGLYLALFQSLGDRDPGHLWLFGLTLMGSGAAGSLAGFAMVLISRPRRANPPANVDPEWYGYPWLLFLGTAVALLCLSCGLRLVGDWQRSNTAVIATASGCTTDTSDSGTTYSCSDDWDWNGIRHEQKLSADAQYEDGRQVQLWIDPVTGGADEHSYTAMVCAFIGAGLVGLFDLVLSFALGVEVFGHRRHFRRWLTQQAWWRRLPERPSVALEVPAEPVIEDARPPYAAGLIEDARPPGY